MEPRHSEKIVTQEDIETWEKVKEILQDVLDLPPEERRAYLDAAELSDKIRSEVESLLSFEEAAESLMPVSAVKFSDQFFNEAKNSIINQSIGAYSIISELGYGGMGAVYLAERNDGKFEQRVALKMLKREYNTERLRRNFNREKEILASLSHPNIASLLDAGTTADGIPYLVMEYIEGEDIDVYCRKNALTLNERLKLFNRVCEAVIFAHRNLIIHRDLKPSNILVTKDGVPKLLDFGISKLLNTQFDNHTITHLNAMTPQYASPEQIRGEKVNTAADIYGLGMVLYKILTGRLPYDFKSKSNSEIFEAIAHNEPKSPSEAVSNDTGNDDKTVSAPELKGDVDNILLKSLSKEPERRYESVEQFTADIWRYIDRLPVLARPSTISYRANKFYKRNKVTVIAGALVVLSLFAGITAALMQANAAGKQARIAVQAQQQAETETAKAQAEEAKAKKVSDFMAKIFSYANPAWFAEGSRSGGEAKVVDVLVEMSGKIDEEFPDQPDIQAELHHKFAEVFIFLSKPEFNSPYQKYAEERMVFHARRAIELRRQFYGDHHELVAKDLYFLFTTANASATESAETLMKGIQMMRETNPKNLNYPHMLAAYAGRLSSPSLSDHQIYLQAVLPATDEGKYEIAETYFQEALLLFREQTGEDNIAIRMVKCGLAYNQAKLGKFVESEKNYQDCKSLNYRLGKTDSIVRLLDETDKVYRADPQYNKSRQLK